jgi:DNA-directed RNA polymerase specialized sigma24 family protein
MMRTACEDLLALVPHLRAFARLLAGGDRRLADDLVRDTVVRALRAERRFVSRANLKAWLSTILRDRLHGPVARAQAMAEPARRAADEEVDGQAWSPADQESRMRSSSPWVSPGTPAASSWRWMGRTRLGAADRPRRAVGRRER